MAGRWRSRTFFLLGVPVLVAGIALVAWERTQPVDVDIELLATPVLLIGLLLLFEGYLARRRERLAGDNPK